MHKDVVFSLCIPVCNAAYFSFQHFREDKLCNFCHFQGKLDQLNTRFSCKPLLLRSEKSYIVIFTIRKIQIVLSTLWKISKFTFHILWNFLVYDTFCFASCVWNFVWKLIFTLGNIEYLISSFVEKEARLSDFVNASVRKSAFLLVNTLWMLSLIGC